MCNYRHWSLSWARCSQSTTSHPLSLRSILISFHLLLLLTSGLFPSEFPTKILYSFLVSFTRATFPPISFCLIWSPRSNVWWSVQVMKFLIMQSSPPSYKFLPLSSEYSPQHPVLKHLQAMFFPSCERPSFTPVQNNRLKCHYVYIHTYIHTDTQQMIVPCVLFWMSIKTKHPDMFP